MYTIREVNQLMVFLHLLKLLNVTETQRMQLSRQEMNQKKQEIMKDMTVFLRITCFKHHCNNKKS